MEPEELYKAHQTVVYWCKVITEPVWRRLTIMWWALLDRPIISRVGGSVTVVVSYSDEVNKHGAMKVYDSDVEIMILEEGKVKYV